jgi:hypothetical protein
MLALRPRLSRWLILPAVLVLGLAAGTLIGLASDHSARTITSVRSTTEVSTTVEFVTITKTVNPDPPDHSIQLAEAATFGSSYCSGHEAEIMEHVVSERVLEEKTVILGKRFGATPRAAKAITDACYLVLPGPR